MNWGRRMLAKNAAVLCSGLLLCLPACPQGSTCTPDSNHVLSGVSGNADTGGPAGAFWQQEVATLEAQAGGAATCTYVFHPAPPGNPVGYFWTGVCKVFTHPCTPPVETVPGPSCPKCGQPISLASGNTYIQQTDIRVPGLGQGLTLTRTWNSIWPSTQTASQVGFFGPNWRSTYEERIFQGDDGAVKYARADGSFWSFGFSAVITTNSSAYHLIAPANETVSLVYNTIQNGLPIPGPSTLTFKNGEQRLFDPLSGSLVAIVDAHGNTTQLSYDATNRLVTVTDPASRHLNFTYNANNNANLVTGVTSDVGLSLSYSYDSQGRLTTVTKPDQTTVSFEYDDSSMITRVKDSLGKMLETHTYDSMHRGLTSSKAGGVEALGVTYPQ
jgi:YD repeat-containing protein